MENITINHDVIAHTKIYYPDDLKQGNHIIIPSSNQDSQRSFRGNRGKELAEKSATTKLISSMKRYASKERFLKILDQIASTAMKIDSLEQNKGEDIFQIKEP